MNITFDAKQDMEIVTIFPGEYHATKQSRIIATVLGSCIAVAMFDPVQKVGGMNHFMLPDTVNEDNFYLSKSGKYGMYAMELLINNLLKLGAQKNNIKAKVFGGGHVLDNVKNFSANIPDSNIRFALGYLNAENIPVVSQDVGGNQARKVLFYTETAKIMMKRIKKTSVKPIETTELSYYKKIHTKKASDDSNVTLF